MDLCVLLTCLVTNSPCISEGQLNALLVEAREEMQMPGLRAAVRLPDGTLVRCAVGWADVEGNIALNNTIGMPGGSTGKIFVAAVTMRLVETGKLSLDDPISKWVGHEPWFKKLPNRSDILVRHLLSHSSGLSDYPGRFRFNMTMVGRVLRHGSAKFEPDELIGYVAGRKPLFPAGKGFHYSDAGYLILGKVIEAATDEAYYDLVQKHVLNPLELHHIKPQNQTVLTNIAMGYMRGSRCINKHGKMKLDPSSEWTGGGLTTNPTMLVTFLAALAEGRVVQPESVYQMVHSGWRDPQSPDSYYGFGLFVDRGGFIIGHGGLWPGYRTHVTHLMKRGITIAVQTNRDGRVDLQDLVSRIAVAAMDESGCPD